jgi:hypothetical protein
MCAMPVRTKRMNDRAVCPNLHRDDVRRIPSISSYEKCVDLVLHWWGAIELVGAILQKEEICFNHYFEDMALLERLKTIRNYKCRE